MSDSTFRSKITPTTTTIDADAKAGTPDITPSSLTDHIEVPYTEYKTKNENQYLVDHYEIGDTWQEKLGGFETEVNTIDMYIRDKIDSGLMDNSLAAVKETIKKLEKQSNVNKEDRTVSKIAKISAYAEFLMKTKRL